MKNLLHPRRRYHNCTGTSEKKKDGVDKAYMDISRASIGIIMMRSATFLVLSLTRCSVMSALSLFCNLLGPPCRAFTPTLIQAYKAAKEKNANFELVFVSSDQDQEGFDEYYADMPWPAINFEAEHEREAANTAFGIKGIPSLQVVGKDGHLITADGRTSVQKEKEAAIIAWASK